MDKGTFSKYLDRLHNINLLATSKKLNMNFGTRDAGTNKPWVTGYVWEEGASFSKDTEGYAFINFYLYNWMEIERWDAELARVEKWIREYNN